MEYKDKTMCEQRHLNLTPHILLENNICNECFLLCRIYVPLQLFESICVDYIYFSPLSLSLVLSLYLSLHLFRSLPLFICCYFIFAR